jgi:WD40 repeat protein
MYAGTETGDVLKVSVDNSLFKKSGPAKKPFPQGANVVLRTNTGDLVVGAGDGTIAVLSNDNFKVLRKTKVAGGVTSLALNAAGDHFFVGTKSCNIYLVNLDSFEYELRNTCHFDKINDIAYPRGYSELFATCSKNDIRVWHARTRNELLRIQVPGLTCLCVAFMPDGKSIVSGWSDGKIRAFRPQTGKLMYAINDAHRDGVTAIACTSDSCHIVSGGEAGQVRVWEIQAYTTKMKASMKEHRGPVNSIKISADDEKCVSASSDGSCIQWNLNTFVRMTCLFASTQFQAVVYHPDQSQLLTTGSDRKLTYWDVVDGIPIRIIDGSQTAQLNTLDITEDGSTFASGGGEKIVQVWGYDDGYHYYSGVGHSGDITAVQFSPDQQTVVSVGEEGAIFLWTSPKLPELDE